MKKITNLTIIIIVTDNIKRSFIEEIEENKIPIEIEIRNNLKKIINSSFSKKSFRKMIKIFSKTR